MNITRLTAENVKRLRAVEITPEGNTVIIGGRNAQGKSSVLDSITMALGGKDSIPERPIRDGENAAMIVLETHEITVTRKFSANGGSSLVVTNKEGVKQASPQAILDSLTAKISFDPLQFTRMDKRQCAETLRKLLGLDFTADDAEAKRVYDERTNVNRNLAAARARLSAYPKHEGVPAEVVSVSELAAKLSDAMKANAVNAAVRADLQRATSAVATAQSRCASIQQQIEALQRTSADELGKRESLEKDRLALESACKTLADIPTEPFQESIANAETVNTKVRSNIARSAQQSDAKRLNDESDTMTARLAAIEAAKHKKLSDARFPVEGLSLSGDSVQFNGIPLEQASAAEQLRVSLSIACAMNPKMKVMLIRDGSLLDQDSLALVREVAEKNAAQVWIEVVGERADCAVVIEDGAVKE